MKYFLVSTLSVPILALLGYETYAEWFSHTHAELGTAIAFLVRLFIGFALAGIILNALIFAQARKDRKANYATATLISSGTSATISLAVLLYVVYSLVHR